jgi:hypothetical protein
MSVATAALKTYAHFRRRTLAREDAAAAQQAVLTELVTAAASTRFGGDHGFADIRTVADFQARVPLRRYGQLWEDYWQPAFPRLVDCTWPGTIPYFAVSSGTSTGQVKHIPCTMAMVKSNKRAALDIFVHHLAHRPDSRVFDGKSFVLGGSTDLKELAPGVRAGDISGIAAAERPWYVSRQYFPPRELTFITDWEEKIDRLSRAALKEDIRLLSGAPGWLSILFERLGTLKPEAAGRVKDLFPNLEILIHGGVSFAPYRGRFAKLLEGSRVLPRETYPASEGFVAIADRGPGEGLRVIADNGLFYEFVPVDELDKPDPTRHWLGTVETGVDYAIVLTTCAGLWGYVIGDVVRFVDVRPPRLLITGRTSYMLSAFGEHVTGELVETAVLAAAAAIEAEVGEFSVGTRFSTAPGSLGHHVYVVEFAAPVAEAERRQRFAEAVDRELSQRNEDYCERRLIEGGVTAPVVHVVAPGTFAAWMKARGRLGGQNKVPRIIGDSALLDNLLGFIDATHART